MQKKVDHWREAHGEKFDKNYILSKSEARGSKSSNREKSESKGAERVRRARFRRGQEGGTGGENFPRRRKESFVHKRDRSLAREKGRRPEYACALTRQQKRRMRSAWNRKEVRDYLGDSRTSGTDSHKYTFLGRGGVGKKLVSNVCNLSQATITYGVEISKGTHTEGKVTFSHFLSAVVELRCKYTLG